MEYLYAPWRSTYIQSAHKAHAKACFFCANSKEKRDEKNLILVRRKHVFIQMNLFPYSAGHLMVAPYRHRALPADLSDAEWLDFNEAVRQALAALKKAIKPGGFNVGMNLGKAAGAGVEGHLHLHVVPRWIGDTNFMPVTGHTKLINQDLAKMYKQLSAVF